MSKQTFDSITSQEQLDAALSSSNGKVVILDFYAPWCAPCKNLKDGLEKVYDTLSEKAVIYTIDSDTSETISLVEAHKVRNVPTLIFYKDGVVVDRFTGNLASKVVEIVNKHS